MTDFDPVDYGLDTCRNCGAEFHDHAEADVHGSLECPTIRRGVQPMTAEFADCPLCGASIYNSAAAWKGHFLITHRLPEAPRGHLEGSRAPLDATHRTPARDRQVAPLYKVLTGCVRYVKLSVCRRNRQ